jgi:sugar phosphate permease
VDEVGAAGRRRWLILALGLAAQAASCCFIYGLPYLLPALRSGAHLDLARAGAVIACPTAGVLLALVAWGAAADRYGERIVMAVGLGAAGVLLLVAVAGSRLVAAAGSGLAGGRAGAGSGVAVLAGGLVLAGAAGASVNAASGRVVLGWFSARERGLAMGARQTAQPLGVALASVTLPVLAARYGYRAALVFPAVLCLVVAALVAALVRDPPRPARAAGERPVSPYRRPALWRVHGASALLVVPQFAVSAFALEFLVAERHWDAAAAGRVLGVAALAGALGRLAAGAWSDRVASRLGPMRLLAAANAVVMAALAAAALLHSAASVVALLVGAVITVSTNGLAFTATAELAGHAWAGRALGVQNTGQNLVAAAVPAALGALITATGYGPAFLIAATFPVLAALTTPPDQRTSPVRSSA